MTIQTEGKGGSEDETIQTDLAQVLSTWLSSHRVPDGWVGFISHSEVSPSMTPPSALPHPSSSRVFRVYPCRCASPGRSVARPLRNGRTTVARLSPPTHGLWHQNSAPDRRIRTLQPTRGRLQLVFLLRGHDELDERRVLHQNPGLVPLQTRPAAAALRLPPEQLDESEILQPHHPLGKRQRPQPLWTV